ncbi:MAG: ATP-dependent protease ATPase subunit HslU [Spirochaetaceae bacterium]|nr:MAG: ATP-dependent protease ATPase subunit HslU [Spirochaetaceae bacterium]
MKINLEDMAPAHIVEELDRFIIGQQKAKKAVAIALRNRIRRERLPEELRDEVMPKNIIMIGPTGVGKTEIARRLSKLTGAPFIKVEATKYTEVGYVGRDVESMVRDLMASGVAMVKSEQQERVREEAEKRTEELLLDLLLPGVKAKSTNPKDAPAGTDTMAAGTAATGATPPADSSTREKFRQKLRNGDLEQKEVEVSVTKQGMPAIEIFSGSSFEEMEMNLGNLGAMFGGRKKKKRTTIARAREILLAEEMEKLVDTEQVAEQARQRVEQMGIIFIDEIDKIAAKENRSGVDVSREGVQRDILPIVEGSQVNTKYGIVDTSHILFIAAGAFHTSKPSDLIPELQGRFPLRVELEALDADAFYRILTQPQNSLVKQYTALMATENVTLDFSEEAIVEICRIAADVNSRTENIGARRLHTVMEVLLEEVSYTAAELSGQTIPITPAYVQERLGSIIQDQDLSRYIL